MEFLPLGLACSVLRGNGITHLLEMAHADFAVVTRGIWRRSSGITIFGKEIAVGDVRFFGGVTDFFGTVSVADAFEGFVGFVFEARGVVIVAELFGGLVSVFL